jgi:hypothetical protein
VRSVQATVTSALLAVALGAGGLARFAGSTGLSVPGSAAGDRLGRFEVVVAAVAALVVVLVAAGWGALFDLPDRPGVVAVLTLTGLGSLALVVWRGRGHEPLGLFAAAVAAALMLAFARELLRRDGRTQLVESVTGTLSGQVVTVLAAGWVLLPHLAQGRECLVLGAGVTAAAVLGDLVGALPSVPDSRRPWVGGLAALVSAAAAAVALARFSQPSLLMPALVLAPLAAGVVSGLGALLMYQPAARSAAVAMLAGSAARVAVMGTVAYAVLRLVAGA